MQNMPVPVSDDVLPCMVKLAGFCGVEVVPSLRASGKSTFVDSPNVLVTMCMLAQISCKIPIAKLYNHMILHCLTLQIQVTCGS